MYHSYFMSVALLSAKRSKDPRTQVGFARTTPLPTHDAMQVGAVIVNPKKRIVGIGYNGAALLLF